MRADAADTPDQDQPGDEPRRLLSLKATARVLGGITEREIRRRVAADELELVKLGRRSLITMASIDAYVEKLRDRAKAAAAA